MNTHRTEQADEPLPGHTSPLLYNLVYCSRATEGVDATAVDQIIATSRRYNPERSITGLLVFGSGIFFQWLEGPRDSVLALLALIIDGGWYILVAYLLSAEAPRQAYLKFKTGIDRTAGTVMGLLGLKLVTSLP